MSNVGRTLFGGPNFIRLALTPLLILFLVAMPLTVEDQTGDRLMLMVGLELIGLGILAGFWLPARFRNGAFRVVTAVLFAGCAIFLYKDWSDGLGVFLAVGVPALVFTVRGRFSFDREPASREPSAEEIAEREEYESQILKPDWAFYERHLQRPAPAALRELYADRDLVTSVGLDYPETLGISGFESLDQEGLDATRDQTGFDAIAIATGGAGDPIHLKPGAAEPDVVYVTCHDSGDSDIFANSVEEMMKTLKEANS